MSKFEYQQQPHSSERKHQPTHAQVTGLNNRIGLWITKKVGTMWAAYLFAGLALISLPSVLASGDIRVIVDWVAQTLLQLVLVSVIIVGQNQQTAQAEIRAEATYKDATALLHEVKQLQLHLVQQDHEITALRNQIANLK
jgi:hypothetical protein